MFKAQPLRVRRPANGKHDLLGFENISVAERTLQHTVVLFDLCEHLPGDDFDTLLCHFSSQVIAHIIVKPTQDLVTAIKQRRVHAEPCKYAGKLDSDIAAAGNHDALRQRFQVKRFIGTDHMLDARQFLIDIHNAAGGNQNVLCRHVALLGNQEHRMRITHFSAGVEQFNPAFSRLEM